MEIWYYFCARQNNGPPGLSAPRSQEAENMTVYMAGTIKIADRIKIANQLTLKWEDYPGFSWWAQGHH